MGYTSFDVILVGVIATVLICGATCAIPAAAWIDHRLRDRFDRR